MADKNIEHRTITKVYTDFYIPEVIDAFLIDKKVQNLSQTTIGYYLTKLSLFWKFCESQQVKFIFQIDTRLLREFLLWLESTGHNPGGIQAVYRAIKVFLKWFEGEFEPEGWINPINKVKVPRVAIDPLEPVSLETVKLLMDQCGRDFTGCRDRALMLFLLDTGTRAREALAINLTDLNQVSGEVLIQSGKGRKPRRVYIGKATRKAVRAYLNHRSDNSTRVMDKSLR